MNGSRMASEVTSEIPANEYFLEPLSIKLYDMANLTKALMHSVFVLL